MHIPRKEEQEKGCKVRDLSDAKEKGI